MRPIGHPAAAQLPVMNLGRAGRFAPLASGIDDGFHSPVRHLH